MRLKSLKKLSFLMSVVMVMTFLVLPVTSGASEKRDGKIVFKEAELKELELTSVFKEKFSIDASVEKAKFAFINDKTPGYFIVTVRDSESVRTPLELKSDGKGNLYSEISYEKESTSILPYDIIAVDSALDPLNTQLSCDPNYFSIDSGIRSLYNYYIDWSTDLLELSKLDRGVPGKIKFKCIMSEHCPFKSLSYKTAKDGEYKELSFKGRDSEYIDLKSKYFAFKYELKDYYEIEGSELLVDGIPTPVIGEREGDSYIFEDITMSVHSTEDPLKDCGYIFVFGSFFIFPDNDSGITYTEPSAGDVSYKLNLNKEEDKVLSGDVTINDLIVKNGELNIFGVDEGVTPYNLIVKGTNKISYLIFNTPVTVTCEPGATLAFDKFNYEDPDPDNPKPDFDFILGENTVYDKEAKMFRSSAEPTGVPKPTETATPTPVATVTATPTPTVAATATATPTVAATATPTPTAAATETPTPAIEVNGTPTVTPTPTVVETPKAEEPAATDGKVVTVKSYVYKVNQDNTASLQAVNPKDKNVSLPASIKVNGKSVKVTTIEANAFKNSKAQNVTLGKNIKKISSYAFNNCKKLISVKANANLQAIEANAFSKCPKFRSFDISKAKKIKTINAKAFSGVKTAKLKVQIAKKAKKKIVPALKKAKVNKSNIKVK